MLRAPAILQTSDGYLLTLVSLYYFFRKKIIKNLKGIIDNLSGLVYANTRRRRLISVRFCSHLLGDANRIVVIRQERVKNMPITMLNVGEKNSIKRVGGKEETRLFLEKLGFVVGALIQVVSAANGNVIVNVKDSRVAIGKDMANKIFV